MLFIIILLAINLLFARLMVMYVLELFEFVSKYCQFFELFISKKYIDEILYYNTRKDLIRNSYIPHIPIFNIVGVIGIIIFLVFFKNKVK
jgi:hypothetical protein